MKRYIVIKAIRDNDRNIIDVEIIGIYKTKKEAERQHLFNTVIKEIEV